MRQARDSPTARQCHVSTKSPQPQTTKPTSDTERPSPRGDQIRFSSLGFAEQVFVDTRCKYHHEPARRLPESSEHEARDPVFTTWYLSRHVSLRFGSDSQPKGMRVEGWLLETTQLLRLLSQGRPLPITDSSPCNLPKFPQTVDKSVAVMLIGFRNGYSPMPVRSRDAECHGSTDYNVTFRFAHSSHQSYVE